MFLRLTLLLIGLVSSYAGSLCFQTGSASDMAAGGGALLVAMLCFFFLGKGLWRFLGCMSTFILMAVIVAVIFFLISGSDMIKDAIGGFLNKSDRPAVEETVPAVDPDTVAVAVPAADPAHPLPAEAMVGLPPDMKNAPQSMQIPQMIKGHIASIVAADVFRIAPHTVRLFGIASPTIDQQCLDAGGHSYECGYVAARKLKDFVSGDEVTCRVMSINAQNELMAACTVATFDIGAAMVEAGWAVALPAVTTIYLPYQTKAQQNRSGLWAGRFQMPWEWKAEQRQIQAETAKITVPKLPAPVSKKKRKSVFDFF